MVDDALETSSTVTIAANQTSADLTVQTDADDAVWEEHSTVTASTEPGDLYVQAQPADGRRSRCGTTTSPPRSPY